MEIAQLEARLAQLIAEQKGADGSLPEVRRPPLPDTPPKAPVPPVAPAPPEKPKKGTTAKDFGDEPPRAYYRRVPAEFETQQTAFEKAAAPATT